jgi:hypothetical protein
MMDELTYEQLRALARRKHTTTSLMIREAVARYVVAESGAEQSPLEDLIGMFDGPAQPLGERTEEILAEAMNEKLPRRHDDTDR